MKLINKFSETNNNYWFNYLNCIKLIEILLLILVFFLTIQVQIILQWQIWLNCSLFLNENLSLLLKSIEHIDH